MRLDELSAELESERFTHKTLADGSGILLDVEGMRVMSLNASGMVVLEAVADGARDVDTLARKLTSEFEVELETARRDVEELLAELGRTVSEPRRG